MSDERTMETTPTRRRLFSLDEANALVPRVGRLVTRLQRTAAQLAQVQANLQNPGASPVADPDGSEANLHGKRLFHLMNDADHFIEIIQAPSTSYRPSVASSRMCRWVWSTSGACETAKRSISAGRRERRGSRTGTR